MAVLDLLFNLYRWGAVPVLAAAVLAVVPAALLNRIKPGQFLDAWLLCWSSQLIFAAIILQIGGYDLKLMENQLPSSSSGDFGAESDFYFGAVKGTSVTAFAAIGVFLFRRRTTNSPHETSDA